MPTMIKPQLIRVERYLFHIKCPYCNYEWDSETMAERRMSCSKCKSSLRFERSWRKRVPQPKYYAIDPETGKEIELYPSKASPGRTPTTESVNDNDSSIMDITSKRRETRIRKEKTNVKSKSN